MSYYVHIRHTHTGSFPIDAYVVGDVDSPFTSTNRYTVEVVRLVLYAPGTGTLLTESASYLNVDVQAGNDTLVKLHAPVEPDDPDASRVDFTPRVQYDTSIERRLTYESVKVRVAFGSSTDDFSTMLPRFAEVDFWVRFIPDNLDHRREVVSRTFAVTASGQRHAANLAPGRYQVSVASAMLTGTIPARPSSTRYLDIHLKHLLSVHHYRGFSALLQPVEVGRRVDQLDLTGRFGRQDVFIYVHDSGLTDVVVDVICTNRSNDFGRSLKFAAGDRLDLTLQFVKID